MSLCPFLGATTHNNVNVYVQAMTKRMRAPTLSPLRNLHGYHNLCLAMHTMFFRCFRDHSSAFHLRVISVSSGRHFLLAPSSRPPRWSRLQLVEESSLCSRKEAVATWPTLLSSIAGREWATFLVQWAKAFTESFTLLKCGVQFLYLPFDCCGASQALELAAFMVSTLNCFLPSVSLHV